MASKTTVRSLRRKKEAGERIVALSLYDAPTARIADACGVDILLVGDSVAMAALGLPNTLHVGMEAMLHHCAAVARGASSAMVVGDMPFMSFQTSPEDALRNAARFIREAGADAVKIEGGADVAPTVARLVAAGVPVMGHVGLLPQKVLTAGGYLPAGRGEEEAARVLADAKALEQAGAFSVVLECLPAGLAVRVTREVAIPTIGIGAGAGCDGQVQVLPDILGLDPSFTPRHSKKYADGHALVAQAVAAYAADVRSGAFPEPRHAPAPS